MTKTKHENFPYPSKTMHIKTPKFTGASVQLSISPITIQLRFSKILNRLCF